jgi:hypothetical protein
MKRPKRQLTAGGRLIAYAPAKTVPTSTAIRASNARYGDRSTIAQRLKTSSNALKDVKNTLYQLQSSTRVA